MGLDLDCRGVLLLGVTDRYPCRPFWEGIEPPLDLAQKPVALGYDYDSFLNPTIRSFQSYSCL